MSHRLLHKFQNKSVQQIVQELMYDEYLERDNMLRNAFNSSPLKAVKKKIVFPKNTTNIQPSSSLLTQQSYQCKIIGVVALQKKKHQEANNDVPKNVKKASKPKELRGLSISISDHMDNLMREKSILPRIQRQTQKSSAFNDDDFEGYRLQSEEMSLEIDEYMRMKRDKDSFQLPNIYSRNQ